MLKIYITASEWHNSQLNLRLKQADLKLELPLVVIHTIHTRGQSQRIKLAIFHFRGHRLHTFHHFKEII